MTAIRETLVQNILTALNTNRPTGVPAFTDGDPRVATVAQLPTATLVLKDDSVVGSTESGKSPGPLTVRLLLAHVEVRTANTTSPAATARANGAPIAAWVSKALPTVNTSGCAHSVYEGITTWEYASEGEADVCLTVIEVYASHQHRRTDAEQWA